MVRDLNNTVFRRWQTPAISDAGKFDFMDDLSVVYVDFGPRTLMDAMDDLRQSSKFRPKIADIREACGIVKSKTAGVHPNAHQADLNEYHARLRSHPEEFLPICLIVRDFNELRKLEKQHEEQGLTIDPQERADWLEYRNKKTEAEWAQMCADGRARNLENQSPSEQRGREMQPAESLFR